MLLFQWTKVIDLMLLRGPLPFLTKPGFAAVDAFVTQYYTKLVRTVFFIMDGLMCTAYTNLANTFLISFPSENSDLSSVHEA